MKKSRFFIASTIGLLLSANVLTANVFADSNPIYLEDIQTLKVPAVDVAAKPGFYQDVTIEFFQEDKWRLVSASEGKEVAEIDQVTLTRTDSAPAQVFLRITGQFNDGCPKIGQISHRLVGNTFEVSVYYKNNEWLRNPPAVACTLAIVPFNRVIPLPVYALPAGDYHYSLNGRFTGSFNLATDNVLE